MDGKLSWIVKIGCNDSFLAKSYVHVSLSRLTSTLVSVKCGEPDLNKFSRYPEQVLPFANYALQWPEPWAWLPPKGELELHSIKPSTLFRIICIDTVWIETCISRNLPRIWHIFRWQTFICTYLLRNFWALLSWACPTNQNWALRSWVRVILRNRVDMPSGNFH